VDRLYLPDGLSWTRASRNGTFDRAISGQSAGSAAALPRLAGYTFPQRAWLITRGSFGPERESPREAIRLAPTAGKYRNGRAAASLAPTGDTDGGKSGAAAAECGPRTDPVPCGTA